VTLADDRRLPGSGPGQALTRVMNIIGIRPLMAAIRA
jgi:hypothetical protein